MASYCLLPRVPLDLEPECSAKCRSSVHASLIINAITKGDQEEIISFMKKLCQNYSHVTDCYGRNALHVAASCGKWKVVRYLLQREHCDCNIRDRESGWTSLHRSLFYGQLTCAKILLEFGANLLTSDHDHYTPLDLVMKDRPVYVDYRSSGLYEVYVWGINQNYNLGLGIQHSKQSPELLEKFRKENISIVQVVMCEYHTVFLSQGGQVFTCGHGKGGRLGQNVEHAVLMPQPLNIFKKEVCVQVAAGKDHNVILMENGCVWTWGSNDYHQLGHTPPPEKLLVPKMISGYKFLKGIKLIGVCAATFHTVMYTEDKIYTFGLNAGQLGTKGVCGKYQTTPTLVSSLADQDFKFTHVVASDGATVCVTKKGDVYVLHEYQCRKIASKRMDVAKVVAIGGNLDTKADVNVLKDDGRMELKILLLLKCGRIHIWSESYSYLTYCFLSLNRLLYITDIAIFNTGLLISTSDGEGFLGTIISPKVKVKKAEESSSANKGSNSDKIVRSFSKWNERDECFFIKLKRINNIHRATAVACDYKGRNFAVIQAHPKSNVIDVPQLSPSEMASHMMTLFREADLYDDVHDAVIKVGQRNFPVHQYILASRCEVFREKFQAVKTTQTMKDQCLTITESNMHPDTMEQILEYLYSNDCKFLKDGEICSPHLYSETKIGNKRDNVNFGIDVPPDIVASTLETCDLVPSSLKLPKNLKKGRKLEFEEKKQSHLSPLKILQDAAKMFGIHCLVRRLQNVKLINGRICTKYFPSADSLHFDRKLLLELSDVVIKSEDEIEFHCHKCILMARAEYFHGMLASKWKETSSCILMLPASGAILQIVVNWLYTDESPRLSGENFKFSVGQIRGISMKFRDCICHYEEIEDVEFLCNVLVTADHFLLPLLKEQCERRLTEVLTLKNACELLEFSVIYNASQLKATCMNFINLNLCALLETKSLAVLSDEALVDLTKCYRQMISRMTYRAVTPFTGDPSLEYLHVIAENHPVVIDEWDENSERDDSSTTVKESKKIKYKRRSHIRKCSETQSEKSICSFKPELSSESDNKCEMEIIANNCNSATVDEDVSITAIVEQSQSKALHSCLETSPLNAQKWLDSCEDMNTAFPDLLNDVREEVEERNVGKHCSSLHRIPKLSQKQRKKLTSNQTLTSPLPVPHSLFVERAYKANKQWTTAGSTSTPISLKEIMDIERKASTCKFLPSTPSTTSSPPAQRVETENVWNSRSKTEFSPHSDSEAPSFSDILLDEQQQFQKLMKKIKTKSLDLIQIEDQAIEELLKYYESSDEHITVERMSPMVCTTPIWKPGSYKK